MKKIITLISFLAICSFSFAQNITTVEGVYGGKINAITGLPFGGTSSDSFKIIIATESANSIFYANAIIPASGTGISIDSFHVLPAASSSAGFGSNVYKIAYESNSKTIFFISNGNVYSAGISATSTTTVATGGYKDVIVKGNFIYLMSASGSNNTFYKGTINASGAVTITNTNNVFGGNYTSLVAGKDNKLYAFKSGNDPQALVFANNFNGAGVDIATTTTDAMPSLSSSISWDAMGVFGDGSVFVGGNASSTKYVAKASAFNTAYTTVNTGVTGVSGYNIDFSDAVLGNYYVYFGSAYSNNKGTAGSWNNFGNTSFQTHPNDGAVFFVKQNTTTGAVVFLATDQGIGITKNSGSVITEVDEGVNAVQVKDFDMDIHKNFGWLASKSGIRYVKNYGTASKSWSNAIFPNSDGAPYYSAEMISQDTAYVGNNRVYKTTDTGKTWTQVFTAENAPYNFTNQIVKTIAFGGSNKQIIMAGYKSNIGSAKGGIFYSTNSGSSWQQLLIHSSINGSDVDVNDIEIVSDSGKVVAYIGVDYDNTVSPKVRGMYKAQWNGSTWTTSEEPIYNSATALYSVKDIVIVSKDTIVAGGAFYNPTLAREYPIHFEISRSVKNTWSSTVVDTSRVGGYTAVSWSKDTIFYANSNTIYWDKISFFSTYTKRNGESVYYDVPVGTEINVLYYDELLAGTETDIRSVRGPKKTKPTATIQSRTSACSQTVITGGSPEGGVYYIVDTTVSGYSVSVDGFYYLLFATKGILTGESSTSFNTYTDLQIAFASLAVANFVVVETYQNIGTYTIAYTNDAYATSSSSITVNVGNSPAVASITGSLTTCSGIGYSTYLYDATTGGTWASNNTNTATINSSGKIIVIGGGSSVVSYTVTNSSGCSAAALATFTVSAPPFVQNILGGSVVCNGSKLQLNNPTQGGVWSSTSSATIDSLGLVSGKSPGNAIIKYTVTNANGCSNFATTNIQVNPLPNVPTIQYAAGTINPQYGAPKGGFCIGKVFTIVGSPAGGSWSATGSFSITNAGVVSIDSLGAASITYTYTNNSGCKNNRTATGYGFACAARGVNNNLQMSNDIEHLTIYPNPAKIFFNLQIDKLVGAGTVVIVDLYGKKLKTQLLSIGMNTIDVSNLSQGLYFVNIITSNQNKILKLVKE